MQYIDPDDDEEEEDYDDIMLVDDLEDEMGDPWGRDVFTPDSLEEEDADSPFATAALLEQPSTSAYSAEGGAATTASGTPTGCPSSSSSLPSLPGNLARGPDRGGGGW